MRAYFRLNPLLRCGWRLACVVALAGGVLIASSDKAAAGTLVAVPMDFPFVHPISGQYGGYGPGDAGGTHEGYDIFGYLDHEPVYAAHSGWVHLDQGPVTSCNAPSGGGLMIVIHHQGTTSGNDSVYTRYHHLSSRVVLENQWVAAGDLIGYQGDTGHTACGAFHLHLEFREEPLGSGVFLKLTTLGDPAVEELDVDYSITAGSPVAFDGVWYFNSLADSTVDYWVFFGAPGDIPVLGDWNGDGRDTPGFVRMITSGQYAGEYEWHLSDTVINSTSHNTGLAEIPEGPFRWGFRGDKVLTGDWDDDNDDSAAVVRVDNPGVQDSLTTFWMTYNKTAGSVDNTVSWGSWPGRYPVKGDWNGDGKDTVGIFHVQPAMWYLTDTSYHTGNGLSYAPFQWGQANDVVMTGDWYQNNYDRPILLQKYPNNFQQPPIWSRNRYLYSSPLLNQFSFGGLGQYPLVCNWDADSYDEYVLVD